MTATGGARPAVLVVDDEPLIRETLREFLHQEGFAAVACASGEEALARAAKQPFDVALCDVNLPGLDGLEVLERLGRVSPETAVLLITAYATVESAVEAFHKGASDYLMKPVLLHEVLGKLRRLLRLRDAERENRWLRRELHREADGCGAMVVGQSPAMRAAVEVARRVAPTPSTVLILGESGTGKELLARRIHRLAQAARPTGGRFEAVSCAAAEVGELEDRLYAPAGGTVFLDEVAELPAATQAKLLRAVEGGDDRPRARVLAATNKDLAREAAEGRFREDLFYRLNVVSVALPPLRERPDDLPELAEFLLAKHAAAMGKRFTGVGREAMARLRAHPWKGNVRELENALQRAVIVGDGPLVQACDLPPDVAPAAPDEPTVDDLNKAVEGFERQHIERILKQTPDKREAAERMNIGLSSLYRKIEKLGVDGRG